MVDQARQRLLATYPEHVVADRLRDLDDIAALADMMDRSALRARADNDVGDVINQVRELSTLINEYSTRHANWRDPYDPNAPIDPGGPDLAGLDPLNPRELANRVVGVDPQTHRFHPIDQAIMAATVGNVLGPSFEAHVVRMLARTLPLDPYHAGQVLSPNDAMRLSRPLSSNIRGLYDPRSDVMFISPTTPVLDPNTGQPVNVPRPLSAMATTLVHESMHALQPGFDRMIDQIRAHVPASDVNMIIDRVRLELEYQGFAVQQHFLRGLAGFENVDLRADPRLPASDRYRHIAGSTPEETLDRIIRGYGIDPASLTPELLARMAQETPSRVVDIGRTAADANTHPDPRVRRPGGLIGPITRDIAQTYGIDLDRLRYEQGQHYRPPLGSPSAGPLPEQSSPAGRHRATDPVLLAEGDVDATPGDGDSSPDADGRAEVDQTGARMRPGDHARAEAWAAEAYDRFRATPGDVDRIAANLSDVPRPDGTLGYRAEEIRQIREHLLFDQHLLDDYEGGLVRSRFDPDPAIAEAWIRLVEGRPLDADLVLLEHELAESTYMREHPGATYREAHTYADSQHNWAVVMPEPTGEDLDNSWGQVTSDGDTGGLREGPRGQSGGRVRFRVPDDGPPHGDREGDAGRPVGGRRDDGVLPGGVRSDPPQPQGARDVAGEGRVRGVTEPDGAPRGRPGPRPPRDMPDVTPGTRRDTPDLTPGTRRDMPDLPPGTRRDMPDVTPGTRRDMPDVTPGTPRDMPDLTPGTRRDMPDVYPGGRRDVPDLAPGDRSTVDSQVDEGGRRPDQPRPGPVVDRRPDHAPDATPAEVARAAGRVPNARPEGPLIVIETSDGRTLHFRPVVTPDLADAAHTRLRSGTPDDPHVVHVDPRVAAEGLPLVWQVALAEAMAAGRADGDGPPPTPTRLRILIFGATPDNPALAEVAARLAGAGDDVALRVPAGPNPPPPGVRVFGAEPIPGVVGPVSPLLRLDGLPAGTDVLVGFGDAAGVADLRRDAYPDARVVQVVDGLPTDPAHLALLGRADLVVVTDPALVGPLQDALNRSGVDSAPTVHDLTAGRDPTQGLHDAIDRVRPGAPRVDDAAWTGQLDPREVAMRGSSDPDPRDPRRPIVMTTTTEWWSTRGGVPTANRELTESFLLADVPVHARASMVDGTDPGVRRAEPSPGLRVVGVPEVWGVNSRGEPDTRALFIQPDGLPRDVDVIVGHSRFSGGSARWLADHVYPDAAYVHVLHTSPEVLDALRGDPAQGQQHARTERELMAGADLVAGVGPLLGAEAARLNAESRAPAPRVHEIIPDMPRLPGDPPGRPADRQGYEVMVQGRAGDPIKAVEFAARLIRTLAAQGIDVRLTVRGAPSPAQARAQAELLSDIAGRPVTVRPFTTDAGQLRNDLYQSDLVLMPSIHEGFGLVASEAARAGVPVVAGEGTGAGLFFGDSRYVPPELGAAAAVRDGVTVDRLRQALFDATGRDGQLSPETVRQVLAEIDRLRLDVWAEHVGVTLGDAAHHADRALALRDFLDQTYRPGQAAARLLAALQGGVPVQPTGSGAWTRPPTASPAGLAAGDSPAGAQGSDSTRSSSP
jgi:glycosyltransferase involved in cell wall biosynthesis